MEDSRKRSSISYSLGKLIVAAAWADGTIQPEEVEFLKDMLFLMPEMDSEQWHDLEQLLNTPQSLDTFFEESSNFRNLLNSEEEREFALFAMEQLVQADGVVTEEEEDFLRLMRLSIEPPASRRKTEDWLSKYPASEYRHRFKVLREKYSCLKSFGEYVARKITEEVSQQEDDRVIYLDIPQQEQRKYCLMGALLSKVLPTHDCDRDRAKDLISQKLRDIMGLSGPESYFIAMTTVCASIKILDTRRLCRLFYEITSVEDRLKFLDILFAAANYDDQIADWQLDTAINIASNLKVDHILFQIPYHDRSHSQSNSA